MQDSSVPRDLALNDGLCARDQRGVSAVFCDVQNAVQASHAVGVDAQLIARVFAIEGPAPSRKQLIARVQSALIASGFPGSLVPALGLAAGVLFVLTPEQADSNLVLRFTAFNDRVVVLDDRVVVLDDCVVMLDDRVVVVAISVLIGSVAGMSRLGTGCCSDGSHCGDERDHESSVLHLLHLRMLKCALYVTGPAHVPARTLEIRQLVDLQIRCLDP